MFKHTRNHSSLLKIKNYVAEIGSLFGDPNSLESVYNPHFGGSPYDPLVKSIFWC
jgi:hypothetical protein